MFYQSITQKKRVSHSGHLRTLEKCRKHSPAARVFYISLVFSNARRVLSQCNARLRLLYLLHRMKIRHPFAELLNFNKMITWHVTWSKQYVKARQDVEFYNQGKVQLGKTNITRHIAAQPWFYFTFLTHALNCLRSWWFIAASKHVLKFPEYSERLLWRFRN